MKKTFYFLSIFILFLINIVDVNALQVDFTNLAVSGYNNNGNSLTNADVFNCNEIGSCGMEITALANSYGGAWGIQSPIPLLANHNYALTIQIRPQIYSVTLSSKPRISVGYSLTEARINYQNSDYKAEDVVKKFIGNNTLQYVFKPTINSSYFIIPFTSTTSVTTTFIIDNMVIEDLGTESLTDSQLTDITNNQTNQINNSIYNSTTIIQDNINDLNDNINENFQNIFENCEGEDNNLYNSSTTSLNTGLNYISGLTDSSSKTNTSDFIEIETNKSYLLTYNYSSLVGTDERTICFYDNNKNPLNCYLYDITLKEHIITNTSSSYLRFSFDKNITNVKLSSRVCTGNKLDDLNDTQKETNDKLDNLNDNITNSDSSQATADAENFFSNFNTDTFGLTSVITAPLELIKSVTSKTCTPLRGNLPFVSTELNLPCLSTIYETHFGSFLTIYRTITFGFVSYWVCIKIFNLVKDFKNPEHDEIEVLDL